MYTHMAKSSFRIANVITYHSLPCIDPSAALYLEPQDGSRNGLMFNTFFFFSVSL